MTSKASPAQRVTGPVSVRTSAAGTALPASHRGSSARRPTARPTVVYLPPQRGSILQKLLAIGVLGLCALVSLWWIVQRDERRHAVAANSEMPPDAHPAQDEWELLASQIPAPEDLPPVAIAIDAVGLERSVLRLGKGDTLTSVLADLDLDRGDVARAISALRPHLDIRRLKVGQAVRVTLERPADSDTPPILHDLTIRPEARRQVTLELDDSGAYRATEKIFQVLKRLQHVAGRIEDSLVASAQKAGVPQGALGDMLRAFAFDVSFQHDLREGDRFGALVEQAYAEDGKPIDSGRLLWAELTTGGGKRSLNVYRFKPKAGRDFFYTRHGESVVRALLRTPLDLARVTISSAFGKRRHPLLGFTRMHTGVDFPAPPGTPVLAAGDGRVAQAGRRGGYGNWVKIAHSGALATGYAHLLRIAPGIRRGARVHQNQVIGFVGSTGLSTGPHLHFELRRNDRPINPLTVAKRSLRTRLAGSELARFLKVVAEFDRLRSGG
jgi:murein DD-endopeptidase MepM/ murein hydrolase activator NlpD